MFNEIPEGAYFLGEHRFLSLFAVDRKGIETKGDIRAQVGIDS
jgi:hypothetical protein